MKQTSLVKIAETISQLHKLVQESKPLYKKELNGGLTPEETDVLNELRRRAEDPQIASLVESGQVYSDQDCRWCEHVHQRVKEVRVRKSLYKGGFCQEHIKDLLY